MVKGKSEGENKSDGAERLEAAAERVEEWGRETKKETVTNTESNAPRCTVCGSTQVHVRIRDGTTVCHRCGHVEQMERKKKEVL